MSAHAREKIFKKIFREKDRALSTRKKRKEKVAPKRKEKKKAHKEIPCELCIILLTLAKWLETFSLLTLIYDCLVFVHVGDFEHHD